MLILARVGKRREALAVVEEGLRLLPGDHRMTREFNGLRSDLQGPAGARVGKGRGKGKGKKRRKGRR